MEKCGKSTFFSRAHTDWANTARADTDGMGSSKSSTGWKRKIRVVNIDNIHAY